MSYYNPFMPTRHLHPRSYGLMVFGGGSNSPAPGAVANAPIPPVAAAPVAPPPPVFTSSKPELANQTFDTEAARDAAEAVVDADNKAIADYNTSLSSAIAGVNSTGLDALGKSQLEQNAAAGVAKPAVTYGADKIKTSYDTTLQGLQTAAATAGQTAGLQIASGQRNLVNKSITDPASLATTQNVASINPDTVGTSIPQGTGLLPTAAPTAAGATVGTAASAAGPAPITAATMDSATTQPAVATAVAGTEAAQGTLSDGSTVTAASMTPTDTAVSNLVAAKGEAIVLNNPVTRDIQAGEIITGAADATAAAAFTEQVQAATATPSTQATVQGQLTELMSDFDGGATPSWAAGAMRSATAQMAARGLGASSMAGQALVQAAMEAALPIAASDAQTVAGFEMANLSNRQQRAMLAAQQRASFMGQEFDQAFQARVQNASRVSDAANMNFTAEQQVALENSRNANTINMANLTNTQAMLMGEAAAISGLELQNLSNQQQAAVQNAQTFLQMDMTNLNNLQQTEMFKAQSVIQSIFTDQAAENAAKQFNASSENQTKQFMANMKTQVNQFNTSQSNAISQFDASETNAIAKFNSDMRNQRDQFNSTNQLVIAQANAQWRQSVATTDTTAQNVANAEAAKASNAFTASTIDQIWQRERDLMSMAWKSSESAGDRANNIILSQMGADAQRESINMQTEANEEAATGDLFGKLLFYGLTNGGSAKK